MEALDKAAPLRCQPALSADKTKKNARSNPDFDGNGNLNCNDFMAFMNSYAAQEKRADFNHDGQLNARDFVAFRRAFDRATRQPDEPKIRPVYSVSADAQEVELLPVNEKSDQEKSEEKLIEKSLA